MLLALFKKANGDPPRTTQQLHAWAQSAVNPLKMTDANLAQEILAVRQKTNELLMEYDRARQ